jgi:hypothetical protein
MPSGPRYTIRANPSGGRYCVWDAERNAIASSPDGARQHVDLGLQEAFDLIDQLVEQADKTPD